MLSKHTFEAMEYAQEAISAGSRAIERLTDRVVELEVQVNSLQKDKDYFMGNYFSVAEERVALLAQVEELEAEAEEMASIFRDLCFWLNNGATIKATDPALPVFIGPELTTNLHIQGPLGRKEGE